MKWQPIETAPMDTLVLLRKDFKGTETPLVVVGEVITFKGVVHHLWRGGYDACVKIYKDEVDKGWDEKFNLWLPLGE